jgi:hypothetical protein
MARTLRRLSLHGSMTDGHETAEGVVGLDIGPSTIAVVSTEDAALEGAHQTCF